MKYVRLLIVVFLIYVVAVDTTHSQPHPHSIFGFDLHKIEEVATGTITAYYEVQIYDINAKTFNVGFSVDGVNQIEIISPAANCFYGYTKSSIWCQGNLSNGYTSMILKVNLDKPLCSKNLNIKVIASYVKYMQLLRVEGNSCIYLPNIRL